MASVARRVAIESSCKHRVVDVDKDAAQFSGKIAEYPWQLLVDQILLHAAEDAIAPERRRRDQHDF